MRYAMVIVVDADSPASAYDVLTRATELPEAVKYVGGPMQIEQPAEPHGDAPYSTIIEEYAPTGNHASVYVGGRRATLAPPEDYA